MRLLTLVMVIFSPAAMNAQQSGTSSPAGAPPAQTTQSRSKSEPKPPLQSEQALQSPVFNQQVADAVLERLGAGLRGHNLEETRSVFAMARFNPAFDGRMRGAFDYYESFHLYYHAQQVSAEGDRGVVVADFDLESIPNQSELLPQRRHARLRMELERVPSPTGNSWRIVAYNPDRFFFNF